MRVEHDKVFSIVIILLQADFEKKTTIREKSILKNIYFIFTDK